METLQWAVLGDLSAELGEVPVYDDRNCALYWIDVFAGILHRTSWEGGVTRSWALPETVGSYALYDSRGNAPARALLALHSGLAELDLETSRLTSVAPAPYDQARERFNDGRCDPAGDFWVGTIRLPGSDQPNGSGHFYKYSRGRLTPEIGGVTVANGIAFSPDGRSLYLADRVNARLLRYPFDPDARVTGEPVVFASLDPASIPDGAAVDTEGGYWIAMFGEGEVRRYTPEGRLDRILGLPVSRPTMCAFAGPNLGTLVVTTARWGLTAEQLEREPLAGHVLTASVSATGLPEPRYRPH